MTSGFPPITVYPTAIDSDYTLYLVYNTSETTTTADNPPWSEEVCINPVASTTNEVWADNGFANIGGELFYYDSVDKDEYGHVNKLKRCARNLGGIRTQFNPAGSDVRGFVIAEHHNQLVDCILQLENFIGTNSSENPSTLDWRISQLNALPPILDDFLCPAITFDFQIVSDDPAAGVVANYLIQINGQYNNFQLDFGDGQSDTTTTQGTHTYAPNANIDPVVTVANGQCTIVQTPITRTSSSQPAPAQAPNPFNFILPTIPDIPPFQFPPISQPPTRFNVPPIVFPCLTANPIGPISILSIIVVEPSIIPSIIVFEDVPNIPSIIIFENSPSIPAIVSFTNLPSIPDIITFANIPIIPSLISFTPISIPSTVTVIDGFSLPSTISVYGGFSLPSTISLIAPSTISLIAPSTISLIGLSNISLIVPSIPDLSLIVPSIPDISLIVPSIPDISLIVPSIPDISLIVPSIPNISLIVPSIPNVSLLVPSTINVSVVSMPDLSLIVPSIPNISLIVPSIPNPSLIVSPFSDVNLIVPSIPNISLIVPSIPDLSLIVPSIPNISLIVPSIPNLSGTLSVDYMSVPDLSVVFPSVPVLSGTLTVDYMSVPVLSVVFPSIPVLSGILTVDYMSVPVLSVDWNSVPSVNVNWLTPPIVSCVVQVVCPGSFSMARPMLGDSFQDSFDEEAGIRIDASDIGIPSEIRVVVPKIPDISVVHSLPFRIEVETPKIPSVIEIKVEKSLPSVIELVNRNIPSVIELTTTSLPSSIFLDASAVPTVIRLELPAQMPVIKLDTSGIPDQIRVVGFPDHIELRGPSLISLVLPEKPEIEMVYKGAPIELKIKLDVDKLTGEGDRSKCVMLVPCPG